MALELLWRYIHKTKNVSREWCHKQSPVYAVLAFAHSRRQGWLTANNARKQRNLLIGFITELGKTISVYKVF